MVPAKGRDHSKGVLFFTEYLWKFWPMPPTGSGKYLFSSQVTTARTTF